LTTAQVLAECEKKPGSELPKSASDVSGIIYTMRNKKLLSSSQTKAGNVHFITSTGVKELEAALQADNPVSSQVDAKNLEDQAMAGLTGCRPTHWDAVELSEKSVTVADVIGDIDATNCQQASAGAMPSERDQAIDALLSLVAERVRVLPDKAPAPVVDNFDIKTKLLVLLSESPLLHADFAPVLLDIESDLRRLAGPDLVS
jgi:hypothetical protein